MEKGGKAAKELDQSGNIGRSEAAAAATGADVTTVAETAETAEAAEVLLTCSVVVEELGDTEENTESMLSKLVSG